MRLQLPAREMEMSDMGPELEADVVPVLHIGPAANPEFRWRVTSPYPAEKYPGMGVLEIRQSLVPPERFKSISIEELLRPVVSSVDREERGWADYLKLRYGWG